MEGGFDDRGLIGARAEGAVAAKMETLGYQVIARNFQIRSGEIDVIARNNTEIVIVEVRSRRNATIDSAIESITPEKVRKVRLTAGAFLAQIPEDYQEVRFFVAAVLHEKDAMKVEIIEDAF